MNFSRIKFGSFIQSYKTSPYVQFLSINEINRYRIKPDQVIKMAFDDFVVGQTRIVENVVNRQRDSVVIKEIKEQDGSTRKIYDTVKAEVHKYQKEIYSSGLLDLKIIDNYSGEIISQEKFPGSFTYLDYWGFYNGNEKALEAEDKDQIQKKQPDPDPSPQVLFREFTQPIFEQVTDFIRDFYRKA